MWQLLMDFVKWIPIQLIAFLGIFATTLSFLHYALIAFDVITGNVSGAFSGIAGFWTLPYIDLTQFETGNQTIDDCVNYVDAYIPLGMILTFFFYSVALEVGIATTRGIISIYKLIPFNG